MTMDSGASRMFWKGLLKWTSVGSAAPDGRCEIRRRPVRKQGSAVAKAF
jgi:hypothetical protein